MQRYNKLLVKARPDRILGLRRRVGRQTMPFFLSASIGVPPWPKLKCPKMGMGLFCKTVFFSPVPPYEVSGNGNGTVLQNSIYRALD
jgi:hypothetical protein